jgi:hypothetical protein
MGNGGFCNECPDSENDKRQGYGSFYCKVNNKSNKCNYLGDKDFFEKRCKK